MQTRWQTQAERHSHSSTVRLESGGAAIAVQPRVAELADAVDRARVESPLFPRELARPRRRSGAPDADAVRQQGRLDGRTASLGTRSA